MNRPIAGLVTVLLTLGCGDRTPPLPAQHDLATPGLFTQMPAMAADGRIAYAQYIEGKSAIFVAEADGSAPRRLTFGVWDIRPHWSPDGKWIAYMGDEENSKLRLIPAEGGTPRAVGMAAGNELVVGWTGDALMYWLTAAGGEENWLYHVADDRRERVLEVEGRVRGFPSPDGRFLGYQLERAGQTTIWVQERASGAHRQLTTEGFENAGAGDFSPDGRYLLYVSTRTGTRDLWRIDLESGERLQLTTDVADDGLGYFWAPDSKSIAFGSTRGGQFDLWILSEGEGDVRRVTNDALREQFWGWTPDGRGLVFTVPSGYAHLYRSALDGGAPVALTSGDWSVGSFDVSRDGAQVVYAGDRFGDYDIWMVPSQGGEAQLVAGGPGFDVTPALSPDGGEVAFQSTRTGRPNIWIAPAAGGSVRRLTTWESADREPRWAPDGKTLLFSTNRESNINDLWTVSAGGGTPKRLTTVGNAQAASWSPDGRAIAFTAITAASKGIATFTVPATGGAPRMIAPAQTMAPFWSPAGTEITLQRFEGGYGRVEIRSSAGALVRVLGDETDVFDGPVGWSADGAQVVYLTQDLRGDGRMNLAVRPAAGGAARAISTPPESVVGLARVAADGAVIYVASPAGFRLVRADVAALVR